MEDFKIAFREWTNELPARGDVDFREVGVEPGSDRGDKNLLRKK